MKEGKDDKVVGYDPEVLVETMVVSIKKRSIYAED